MYAVTGEARRCRADARRGLGRIAGRAWIWSNRRQGSNGDARGEGLMKAQDDELMVERKDAVVWITFNRPQARNALTWNMYSRLEAACHDINADRTVRAVVLTGAGGHAFVAGTDIGQFRAFKTEQDALDYEARGNLVMSTLESMRVPTIAAIAGTWTGPG